MSTEINMLRNYPKSKRPIKERAQTVTEEDRRIARQFGREYFDGPRTQGYGGYSYNPRFWTPVVPDFVEHYNLGPRSSMLDVGCGKGFMLHDFKAALPDLTVAGIDISAYAIGQAMDDVKPFLRVADARKLPFKDGAFDLVIAVNTIHNLNREDCIMALREIERVKRKHAFITVDAWRNEQEHEAMMMWNLTAQTYMHVDDWKRLFAEAGYTGDYYWFIAEST